MNTQSLIFSLFSCLILSPSFSLSRSETNSLSIGMSGTFEGLNPLTQSNSVPLYTILMVNRPLIAVHSDLKWHAEIIKEVPTFENGLIKQKGSKAEIEIEILPSAQWGDGNPVTCRDLEFTLKVGMSDHVSVPDRSKYENIEKIIFRKDSPKKCTLIFKKLRYDNVYSMPDILPEHLEGPIFEKYESQPQSYERNSLYSSNPTHPGLYNGPYLVKEVKLGSHVILDKNSKFYGSEPKIEKIIIKEFSDSSVLEANLVSRSIDMLASWSGYSIDQASGFEKRIAKENLPYKVHFADGVVYMHIDVNLDHPVLRETVVRKALMYGLNRKLMIESLINNHGRIAHHFANPKDPWYTEDVLQYEYNFRKANQLLDQNGWKKGADGIRTKDGRKMTFTILGLSGNKSVESILVFMKDHWKKIGIDIRIKTESSRYLYGEALPKRKFDLAFYSWLATPESNPSPQLHSSNIPTKANSYAGLNYMGYKNKDLEVLIQKLETELEVKKRAAIGKKIVQIYADDLPVLPMYFRATTSVTPLRLSGYQPTGSMFPEALTVEKWKLE